MTGKDFCGEVGCPGAGFVFAPGREGLVDGAFPGVVVETEDGVGALGFPLGLTDVELGLEGLFDVVGRLGVPDGCGVGDTGSGWCNSPAGTVAPLTGLSLSRFTTAGLPLSHGSGSVNCPLTTTS